MLAVISLSCSKVAEDTPVPAKTRADDLASQRRFHEALGEYDKALKLDPAYSQAHYARGKAFVQLGEMDNAAKSFALAAVTFGTSRRLRAFSGQKPLPDLDPSKGSTREFVHLALAVEERGEKIWIDSYRSLGLLLIEYDAQGRKLDELVKKRLLPGLTDKAGVLPEELFAGASPETRESVELGLQIIRIVQVHEALAQRMGDRYDAPVNFQLAFENDQWCAAARHFQRLIEFQTDQVAKEKARTLLPKLQRKCPE